MQIVSALIGGTIAALGGSSGFNMLQSFRLAADQYPRQPAGATSSMGPILGQYISPTDGSICAPSGKSVEDIVSDLQQLRRSEFLRLWLGCEAPKNINNIGGDWNGVLLDNGPILSKVSDFLTDGLFGRKYEKWNGKAFSAGGSGGMNRFFPKQKTTKEGNDNSVIEYEHKFDCRVEASQLDQTGEALVLKYSRHQGRLSPWHSMRDEIRVLPIKGRKDGGVLLGMGCMKWSGAYIREGMLNGSPFCLFR